MYNEIDLHNLDFKLALSIFKRKYNEALKRKDKREILIIHGYGANKLGHIPILATNLRMFLSKISIRNSLIFYFRIEICNSPFYSQKFS